MLVPSGNDAAYVVADYCGSILSPQAKNSQERINVFMEHLNNYLQNQGYENTILYDPSGYDVNALTTVSDLKSVSTHLLEKQWFRDIVSKSNYTATLPDGSTQTWRNTNTFLDQTSEYYNENVKGMPHIRFHDLRHTAATNMHQLTGDFYTVGEVLGHTLAGIGASLGLSMNFEAVTARYVDVRLERKKEVLNAYHSAVEKAAPEKPKEAEPKKGKRAAKKKHSEIDL